MSKIRKKTSYTKEFKNSILKRLEESPKITITDLSDEIGVPRTTIYQWIRKAKQIKTSQ